MSLYEHLKRHNENFDEDFKKLYTETLKMLDYNVFKDAVLNNMKLNNHEEKIAA